MTKRGARGLILLWALFVFRVAIAMPPLIPPLSIIVDACEKRREMCALALHHPDLDPGRVEHYAILGCEAHDMASCYGLGQFYLKKGDIPKAWPALASACFVNHGPSCHRLRDHGLSLPPILSPKPDYGPDERTDYEPIEVALIDSQNSLKECYDRRRQEEGMVEFKAVISGGKPTVTLLRSTMAADFTACIVRRIQAISLPKSSDQTLQRTLQYFKVYTTRSP